MTNLSIYVNNDTQDQPLNTSGISWTLVDINNDYLIFSNGSDVVADGESIPTDTELNQAGVIISATEEVIVPKYFLADANAVVLKEIHNAGNQNKRYVFAFYFDGATASEPVLELWDDEDMDTVDAYSLGNGTPANSWWKGVVTTDGLPGADWAGSALAGATDTHFLKLNNNNGALTTAKTLYCNLKIVIPAGATQGGAEVPILVVKWTSN
jgi:hypothetical protein